LTLSDSFLIHILRHSWLAFPAANGRQIHVTALTLRYIHTYMHAYIHIHTIKHAYVHDIIHIVKFNTAPGIIYLL
jgi:hypothetical protein